MLIDQVEMKFDKLNILNFLHIFVYKKEDIKAYMNKIASFFFIVKKKEDYFEND